MSIQIKCVLLYVCFKFSIDSAAFLCYTEIGLIYCKVIEIDDDVIQLF